MSLIGAKSNNVYGDRTLSKNFIWCQKFHVPPVHQGAFSTVMGGGAGKQIFLLNFVNAQNMFG